MQDGRAKSACRDEGRRGELAAGALTIDERRTSHAELDDPSWLLEAFLPGFKWLSVGSLALGLIEAALYGAWAGALYSALYNFFAGRAAHDAERRLRIVRVA